MEVVNTVEEPVGNEDPFRHPGCFFAGETVVAAAVPFLFPLVVLLEVKNAEMVDVETIFFDLVLVVAECLC